MNTKEAFDRMAKCGVVVEGMEFVGSLSTERILLKQGDFGWAQATEEHAAMLLEAAWHRKWPLMVVGYDGGDKAWFAYDTASTECFRAAPTRLEAMVLAAEQAAKEDRTNG